MHHLQPLIDRVLNRACNENSICASVFAVFMFKKKTIFFFKHQIFRRTSRPLRWRTRRKTATAFCTGIR